MKWAMEELGIPAFVISGQDPGDPSGHAWNCVQIDGIWYDVDLTNDSATAGRSMKIYPAYNVRREWMTRLYPVFPDIAAYYNIPASDRMDRSFHNFWRMDTRDFSHERKCAIPPFFEHTFAFLLFCVIIILRRQRTDAAGTDH
jgi:hypothetical protein